DPVICCLLFPSSCFNDTSTTEIYTLSLHDALPIWLARRRTTFGAFGVPETRHSGNGAARNSTRAIPATTNPAAPAMCAGWRLHRSEEHTSELQSRENLVCRLLLEKKK